MTDTDDELKPETSSSNIGERLKRAREDKKLSVQDVATQLKLTQYYINNLEAQQWDKLHGAAYDRGYLLNYIKVLGLPEAALLADFDREYKSPQAKENMTLPTRKKRGIGGLLTLLLIIALGIAAWYGYQQWQIYQSDLTASKVTLNKQAANEQSSLESKSHGEETTTYYPPAVEEVDPSPTTTDTTILESPATDPDSELTATMSAIDTLRSEIDTEEETDDATQNITEENEEIALTPTSNSVNFQAADDCWVQVKDSNGKVLFSDTIKADTMMTIDGELPLNIIIGRAAAVIVTFNGQVFDMSSFNGGVARFNLGDDQ